MSITRRALIALEGNYLGRVNVTGPGSTRWRGIPALTLGITTGEGTHTEQEGIDAGPVAAGPAALAATVARLDEQEW